MCKTISNRKQWALAVAFVATVAAIETACGVFGVPSGRICETVNLGPDAGVEICGNPADLARAVERVIDAGVR